MLEANEIANSMLENWHVWLVTVVLIVAAVIDGIQLKVPNWITFPLILSGWGYGVYAGGWEGLMWSVVGTVVGLGLLLPAYAVGGMGAGDVKLLAGVGAWMWPSATFYAFCLSAVVGGAIAVLMVLWQGTMKKHGSQFWMIINEFLTIRDPNVLASIATDRKGSMMLLPYGIPIAIGSIAYFAWAGMLL